MVKRINSKKLKPIVSLLLIISIFMVSAGCAAKKIVPLSEGTKSQDSSEPNSSKDSISVASAVSTASTGSKNNVLSQSKAANKNTLSGNKNAYMETDYRLHKDSLSFTRDYGETWIKSDLTADDISETLNFYKSQYTIPENSYYASNKPNGILAFFYGGKPTLGITKDNGKTWNKFLFKFNYADIQKPFTHRIVGFTSDTEGFVGLGTDWSMGTGEAKFCYLTHDGGATWQEKKLPRSGTSLLLGGMAFCDSKTGVVSYNKANSLDEVVPTLYFTNNGANSWTEFKIPFESIIDKIYLYLSKVDSLTFENGTYTLTFSQNDNGKKASFTSSNMQKWTFQKAWRAGTHITG